MRRRDVIAGILSAGVVATAWPRRGRAQEGKTYRVAYLTLAAGPDPAIVEERLRELGYVSGKSLVFDVRSAMGDSSRLPRLAAEIVASHPDVIVAGFGTLTARAAQAATRTLPIIFASVGDPIGARIVSSLARPGANITGVTPQSSEVQGKRLQILKELVPSARVVAALGNPETPFTALALHELTTAAQATGIKVEALEIRNPDQLPTAFEAALRTKAAGLITLEDPLVLSLRQELVELGAGQRLPIIYGTREFAEAGGLISYGVNRRQLYRRAAELVDKILQGAKPADIPVEQPTTFELVVNLRAAERIGLTVPRSLLARADEVIE
jgi:putative ABC transport system substrate-binding protein